MEWWEYPVIDESIQATRDTAHQVHIELTNYCKDFLKGYILYQLFSGSEYYYGQ